MIDTRVYIYENSNRVKIHIATDICNGAIIVDELSVVLKNLAKAHLSLNRYSEAFHMEGSSVYLCTKFADLMEVIKKDESSTKDKESSGA